MLILLALIAAAVLPVSLIWLLFAVIVANQLEMVAEQLREMEADSAQSMLRAAPTARRVPPAV